MTLDEAASHAESKAMQSSSVECGREHMQLAKWLRELIEDRRVLAQLLNDINDCLHGSGPTGATLRTMHVRIKNALAQKGQGVCP
jgi:hypothetical protein